MKKNFYNPSAHMPAYGNPGSHSQNALPIHESMEKLSMLSSIAASGMRAGRIFSPEFKSYTIHSNKIFFLKFILIKHFLSTNQNFLTMTTTNFLKKENVRMNVKFSMKRLLMSMTAIMMAMVTFTACEILNPKDDDENDENGGVAGKRIKSSLMTEASGDIQRLEFTYNSDGTLNREDVYDGYSKRISYTIYTNNPDGTHAKMENFATDGDQVLVYTYDANKKPLKAEGTIKNSVGTFPVTYDYTFQNGRQTRFVLKVGVGESMVVVIYDHNYDSNGRRTSSTETHSILGTRQSTRAYNSDGTLQKVTTDGYSGYPSTAYNVTFTWEDGKTAVNFDDYSVW